MSTFETKTADNFIFDEALDPRLQDSTGTPFLHKNVAYVVDQQAGNGSYTSGEVIVDSQAISASGNFIDWRNAYLVVPKRTLVEFQTDATSASGNSISKRDLIAALKNNSQLDTLKVEANGKTVLTATQGLANLVNVKMLSTFTRDQLQKDGATIGFYPDDVGQVGKLSTSQNNSTKLSGFTAGALPVGVNRGLIVRQQNWAPITETTFMNQANRSDEAMAINVLGHLGTGGTSDSMTAGAYYTLSDFHYVVIIRLRDIADMFDKHPISRGVSYRFTLRFNQASSIATYTAASTTPFTTAPTFTTTQISGSAMPAILCAGPLNEPVLTLGTTTSAVSHVRISDTIDTSSDKLLSGVRLYCPSYDLEPSHQEKLLTKMPVIKRQFFDFLTQTTQGPIAAGGFFNVQVSTSATNPRALIVIPRWAAADQGFYSDVSPFSTVPGSTDGLLSLKNLQIKLGSSYVLPDRVFYGYQMFLDHISCIFAENGGMTGRTSGLITKRMFEANHRYYCFDLSRYPEAMTNMPQMISVEGTSNCQKPVELLCILLYGREAEWDLRAGSMTITA